MTDKTNPEQSPVSEPDTPIIDKVPADAGGIDGRGAVPDRSHDKPHNTGGSPAGDTADIRAAEDMGDAGAAGVGNETPAVQKEDATNGLAAVDVGGSGRGELPVVL